MFRKYIHLLMSVFAKKCKSKGVLIEWEFTPYQFNIHWFERIEKIECPHGALSDNREESRTLDSVPKVQA